MDIKVGQKFGTWTVLQGESRDKHSKMMLLCKCECGLEKYVGAANLKRGKSKSCRQCSILSKIEDISGLRVGKTVALRDVGRSKFGAILTEGRCDCGEVRIMQKSAFLRGKSNGCTKCLSTKHGMNGTLVYSSWRSMKHRCGNPNNIAYKNYGGRGIVVCERWRNSFEAFFEDMGERPEGLQIDRIDNNGNYEPGNCRWVTCTENNNNKRKRK